MDTVEEPSGRFTWSGLPINRAERAWLLDRLTAAAAWLGAEVEAVAVRGVDDAEMARLHEQFSGVAGTTDVLTFDHHTDDDDDAAAPARLSGDIAVCVDVAERSASARGHAPREELLLYAVHGLLHLLGENDTTPEAYERMHAREDAVLEAIGVGAVFRG